MTKALQASIPQHPRPRLAAPLPSRGPAAELKPLGTKVEPNFWEFGAFIDPSGQNQLYHTPHYYSKYDI